MALFISRSSFRHEVLETRRLLSATVVLEPPAITGFTGSALTVDVSRYLDDPALNTQVRFATDLGNIDLELFDQQKPITVTNFLNYVRDGDYDTTIIHRKTDASSGIQVVQGGGYRLPLPLTRIDNDPPIQNEAPVDPVISNTRGTIAMARTSDPNSATSEWFINSTDNTVLDPAAQPPGYAVFGQVINDTIGAVDAIQALPTFSLGDPQSSPFTEVPLRDFAPANQNQSPTADNFVTIVATTLPKLTLTASSTDPSVVTPTLVGNKLTLQYNSIGAADITLTGMDGQGQTVSRTFTATVTAPTELTVSLGGAGNPQSVAFTDADGTVGKLSLKGPGTAAVTFDGTDLTLETARNRASVTGTPAGISAIEITGGSSATSLTISGKGGADGAVNLGGLTADSALRSISARSATFTGALAVAGSLGKLDLGVTDAATITIGGAAADRPASVTFGAARGLNLTSQAPLRSVKAGAFLTAASETAGTITAPALATLTSQGDFVQNVNVAGPIRSVNVSGNFTGFVQADSISSVRVRGDMTGSSVASTRAFAAREKPIGRVTVGGAVTNSIIRAAGNIASVSVGSINASTIFAGIANTNGVTIVPDDPTDFAAPAALARFSAKTSTADTILGAFSIGRVSLGELTPSNGGNPLGLGADTIAGVAASIAGSRFSLRRIDTQADVDAQTAGLVLEDFHVNAI